MAVKIESPVNRTGEGYEPVDNGKPVAIEEWWENKIKLCEKFHQNEFEKKTERFGKYYQGLFYSGKEDRDRLSVNLVFSNANIFTSSILSQNPEVIVLFHRLTNSTELVKSRPGWNVIDAVKKDRVHYISNEKELGAYGAPGPRIVDGLEKIALLIHPEIFKSGKNPNIVLLLKAN